MAPEKPNRNMATLKDVARASGVSAVTASSVLSGVNRVRVSAATTQRIRDTARRLNYVPFAAAQGLRTGRTNVIAFVVAAAPARRDGPWQDSLRGVSDFLGENGQRLMLAMPVDEERELEAIRQFSFGRQVDGLIIQGGSSEDPRVQLAKESGRPFVLLGGEAEACPSASLDLRPALRALCLELAENHGALAVVAPRSDAQAAREFLDGCAEGAQASERPFREWRRAFLPEAAWWLEARAAAGRRPLAVILHRWLLPELCGQFARIGLALGRDADIVYVASGDDVVLPPRGMAVVRLDHYTVSRRAAQLLFQWIQEPGAFDRSTRVRAPALPAR